VKRSASLASLSRDHHQALSIAQKLRRATVESAHDARKAALAHWDEHGRAHFRAEEEVLLPAFAAHSDPYDPLVARVLCDHVAIRRLMGDLDQDETPDLAVLHELGELLADHVR
jgi:hemerythrin HHE cation binding domain-containing protein